MTNFKSFDVNVCCLSKLWGTMNLRKSRSSLGQKRNPSCKKDIKSSLKKGTRNANNTRCSQKSSPKTPLKRSKLVFIDVLKNRNSSRSSSNMNLLTSTPIPNEIRKRSTRSSGDIDEIAKLKSFSRLSTPITSSPIQKILIKTKPCEVRLLALRKSAEQRYSDEEKPNRILRSSKKSPNKNLSKSSLNTSLKILGETRSRSTRSSVTLRPQKVPTKMPNDIKTPKSRSSKSAKCNSISEKHLSNNNSRKLAENHIVLQKESKSKNCIKVASTCAEKFPVSPASKDTSTASSKSNEISTIEKTIPDEISWTSGNSLVQSNCETDNSKSSRYSLRNSALTQKKSCSRKMKDKKSLPELEKETESFKTPRCNLQLQNQHLSKTTSGNRLSSDSLILQDITKTPKNLLKANSDSSKRASRHSLRLEEGQLCKKTTVNESSSKHLSKKTSTKKQNLEKVHQNKKSCKKSSSSKKQLPANKSTEHFCKSLEDIPIDDLVLSVRCSEKRKVKSDGFKLPNKNTLKRKRCAIEAILKADEDYEDDLYESKQFDQFKDLLMDTSDSERSFPASVSTPKFPCTPLIRHKTPKFRDCFSPSGYAISRKAAMEYMYRNKKKKSLQKPPETPVIAEKKRLEYSQVLEDAQKLQKTIESLNEEESDVDDSYFNF